MSNKKPVINYTNREFSTIREDLDQYNRQNSPKINTDKSIANLATQWLDEVAYLGDQLSLNLDFYINEAFADSAIIPDNILRHARSRGYRFQTYPSSHGIATFYITVPANLAGTGPDSDYMPVLKRGSEFSANGNTFILNKDVNFADSQNQIVVAQVNDDTGVPTSYAVRAYGQVISGEIKREFIRIGSFQKFLKLQLSTENVTEVLLVRDTQGKQWYEVEYLSQDVVYRPVINRDVSTNEQAGALLKPYPVPRRFVVEQLNGVTYLQFGHGSSDSINEMRPTDPSNVVLQVYGKDYISDQSFDPSKLVSNDKLGITPANTTLEVIVRANSRSNVNVAPSQLRSVERSEFDFKNRATLSTLKMGQVTSSLEVDNDTEISGDVTFPSSDELRRRTFDAFASQYRAVTRQDYKSMIYSMPGQYGAIKRAEVYQDEDSLKRNINIYVVSEGSAGYLVETNDIVKRNLKTWISRYKMVGDTIDIVPAKIVNIGIEFEVVGDGSSNAVLQACVQRLTEEFATHLDIGESLSVSRIYKILNLIPGVVDTVDVQIKKKSGDLYSTTSFNINQHLSGDGRLLRTPKDVILEIRYPSIDFKGTVR